MFMQLNPPIPLETPKGKAWAVAMIDYGPQWDLQWVTFIHETGECWTWLNRDIRGEDNLTFHLPKPTPIYKKPVIDGVDPVTPMRPQLNGHGSHKAN